MLHLHVQLVLLDNLFSHLVKIFSRFIFKAASKLPHLMEVLRVVLLLARHVPLQQSESQLLVQVPGDSGM